MAKDNKAAITRLVVMDRTVDETCKLVFDNPPNSDRERMLRNNLVSIIMGAAEVSLHLGLDLGLSIQVNGSMFLH